MTDTLHDQNRRFTDMQTERLSKVESEVTHIKNSVDTLNSNNEQTYKVFDELRSNVQRLAVTAEVQSTISKQQADSMSKLADTVTDLAKNDFKISLLEDFKQRTEAHLKFCDAQHSDTKDKLNKTSEMVNRLYWVFPGLLLLIQGAWELYTHFIAK
jgi:chromosome segregation ATPase